MFVLLIALFSVTFTASQPETTATSLSCESCRYGYFDGCNDCTCGSNGIAACQQKFCSEAELIAPYCNDPPTTTSAPVNCDSCPNGYWDGCNTCGCGTTSVPICTMRACSKEALTDAYCYNTSTTTTVGCSSCTSGIYFDGCNTCECDSSGQAICTEMFCKTMLDAYCIEKPTCANCQKFFDGCNTCICNENGLAICTLKYCEPDAYEEAVCNECKAGYIKKDDQCVSIDCNSCSSYFDGCNNCMCNEGSILAACTRKFCPDGGSEMKCNVCVNGYQLNGNQTECVAEEPQTSQESVDCDTCTSGKYFDGCNTCECDQNLTLACTEMWCDEENMGDAYCIENVGCDTCPSGRFFDGCNTCECNDEGIAACTRMACQETEEAYCLVVDATCVLETMFGFLVVIGVLLSQ